MEDIIFNQIAFLIMNKTCNLYTLTGPEQSGRGAEFPRTDQIGEEITGNLEEKGKQ